ncbi:hypothetical protein [Enterococcus sp. BWR-S5]|uniref:hypothetical protein n=1 Tax=Enterococcus sp. BWR-S5 TaxID=2787714 RepID=UPI001922534B|nr:hypothetical protein [Enterococcus sp. BWR-S5]MBL1227603.1 hypothetical protein [Enterococcus sp. BWR-S5]
MKNRRNKLIILGIIVVLVAIGGKIYMDKQETIRQERNQAVKEIQEQATKYIIENYVGIEKIEWRGWTTGSGPITILTSMRINDYPKDNENNPIEYDKNFSTEEHNEFVKWLFVYTGGDKEARIKKVTDGIFQIDEALEENFPETNMVAKEFQKQGIKKAENGSPNAEVKYNWEERK